MSRVHSSLDKVEKEVLDEFAGVGGRVFTRLDWSLIIKAVFVMKVTGALSTVAAMLLASAVLLADGFPFNDLTHALTVDHISLRLSDNQQAEVAATGKVTFEKEQMAILRKFYPSIPQQLLVLASTFNDNVEGLGPENVFCVWTSPSEVGVTLPRSGAKGEPVFDSGEMSGKESFIRISPKGTLFRGGKEISLEDAMQVIWRASAVGGNRDVDPVVTVVRAPPYRELEPDAAELNSKAEEVFQALEKQGAKLGVGVQRSW